MVKLQKAASSAAALWGPHRLCPHAGRHFLRAGAHRRQPGQGGGRGHGSLPRPALCPAHGHPGGGLRRRGGLRPVIITAGAGRSRGRPGWIWFTRTWRSSGASCGDRQTEPGGHPAGGVQPGGCAHLGGVEAVRLPGQPGAGLGHGAGHGPAQVPAGERLGVDSRSVHAFIIGEHGDSELAVWSGANVSASPWITSASCAGYYEHDKADEWLQREVRDSAYEIIRRKGATYYGRGHGGDPHRPRHRPGRALGAPRVQSAPGPVQH